MATPTAAMMAKMIPVLAKMDISRRTAGFLGACFGIGRAHSHVGDRPRYELVPQVVQIAIWLSFLLLSTTIACAQQNCPATPGAGTSNTTCANTAFVQNQFAAKNYVVGPGSSTDSDVALFSGTSGALLKDGGTFSALLAPLMRSYLAGLTLSNDSVAPNSVLDIAAGVATDSTNVALISIGAFTKSTAGAWASGTGSDGMGNGLTVGNNTWYHVCLANNSGAPDIWFDTSAVCANRPSGISDTKFRRIGSFKTDGSAHIRTFFQFGDRFMWDGANTVQEVNGAAPTASRTLVTLGGVPSGVIVNAIVLAIYSVTGATADLYLTDPAQADVAASSTAVTLQASATTVSVNPSTIAEVRTNTTPQIGYRGTNANNTIINTMGWVDTRGRFN